MSTYIRSFSERVADVPGYLKRHLALIRDLDEKVVALQLEIEAHSRRKLTTKAPETSKRQKLSDQPPPYDIDSALTRLLSLADEKVNIAAQVYDFIDKHIQCLDDDLRNLRQGIDHDKGALGIDKSASAADKLGIDLKRSLRRHGKLPAEAAAAPGAGAAAGASVRDSSGKLKGGKAGGSKKKGAASKGGAGVEQQGAEEAAVTFAHTAGEHEPLYCTCQQPSWGEMVACDNEECQYEWFHLPCVGLTAPPPEGQSWYCPNCAAKLGLAAAAAAGQQQAAAGAGGAGAHASGAAGAGAGGASTEPVH